MNRMTSLSFGAPRRGWLRALSRLAAGGALCLGVLLGAAHAGPVQTDWKKIKAPALRDFKPQQPTRIQLDNGMVIFLQPNPELPLITLLADVQGGSGDEPADKIGLSGLYAHGLRYGGIAGKTGDQIDDFLAARAAQIGWDDDVDSVGLRANFHKNDFDDVLGIIIEMLRTPQFAQDKLDLAKRQAFTGIARRNDDPMDIADRESEKLALGANHPHARQAEFSTVASVTREDLLAWHRAHVHPNQFMLGVTGDFDAATMEAKLRRMFAGWPKGPQVAAANIPFAPTKPGIYLVNKEDVNQSSIRLVQLGTTRKNPDVYAIEVMNEILGGGFAARLFTNIRSRQALAYNVRGGVGMGWGFPSLYRMTMGTASKNTVRAVKALYAEVNAMLNERPPTVEELAKAKEGILNSFVFQIDSKAKTMRQRMSLENYGYPPDYYERYQSEIAKVTLDDVKRVAAKYLNPTGFALLVVGKAAEFDAPLSTLGSVTNLDITIPPPPAGAMPTAGPGAGRPSGK